MTTVSKLDLAERPTRPERHLPGEAGTWVFIFGDMGVFAVFFCTYLYYRGEHPDLFNDSQLALRPSYGVINTLFLLASSLCVVLGIRAVRAESRKVAPSLFFLALLCGLGFAVMKFVEYSEKLSAGITPVTNSFFMYYYILTGLHFFHVVLGMAVLIFLIVKSRATILTARQFAFMEGGACFWHMVDLLWIVLFPLVYLVK
ncbi:MAG TPA: cytochrome c oxidase subunit 3 family protein [Pseudonocardia sp.]|jgi:nitric oxide reductase NorE protein|uniref:cytochrome c oxidase subunit 3 family protein n=1 Tax=Pseudonocardia sp. TaxID=60912 RepID=UPI002C3651FA|nr:cytochrome c oxidase subunit 3 family protein [Pseudonocardia sp.]HTF54749.1 cytochrome c oxidase subunit 3 family protein [Pseudonocardia sp.]